MYASFMSLQSSGIELCSLGWIPFILGLLLPFLLGYLLGMLIWRKYKSMKQDLDTQVARLEADKRKLHEDLADCKQQKGKTESELALLRGQLKEMKIRLEEEARANMAQSTDLDISTLSAQDLEGNTAYNRLLAKTAELETQLEESRKSQDLLRSQISQLKTDAKVASTAALGRSESKSSARSISEASLAEAKAVFGKTIVADDLKIVEGIGPKIEELCKSSGITSWYLLSITPIEDLQKILDDAGPRYRIHSPTTWPTQAQMAYDGKWQALKDWQDVLDGGKA